MDLLSQEGPPHQSIFQVKVTGEELVEEGQENARKVAEKIAAEKLRISLMVIGDGYKKGSKTFFKDEKIYRAYNV